MEAQEITQKLTQAQGIFNKALAVVDDGSFFRKPLNWVYKAIGILGAIFQIVALVTIISETSDMLGSVGAYIFYVLLVLAFIVEIIITVIYWWKRSKMVTATSEPEDEIFVIPIIAHIIQCAGEITGIRMAILAVIFFFFPFFAGDMGSFFVQYIILPIALLVGFVIMAYLTVVFFRYIAECIKAKAITANAAKKITRQLDKK